MQQMIKCKRKGALIALIIAATCAFCWSAQASELGDAWTEFGIKKANQVSGGAVDDGKKIMNQIDSISNTFQGSKDSKTDKSGLAEKAFDQLTDNSLSKAKKTVDDFKKEAGKIKHADKNIKKQLNDQIKNPLKAMNVTGDAKGGFAAANPFGNVIQQAQQSFDMVKGLKGGDHDADFIKYVACPAGFCQDSKRDKAYDKIKKQIGNMSGMGGFGLGEDMQRLGEAQGAFNSMRRGNVSSLAKNFLSQTQSDVTQYVMQKVAGAVNGGGFVQLFDPRAMTALALQGVLSAAGPGIPTNDPINQMLGVFNVESVYGHSFEFEDMRDYNTQFCSAVGVSDPGWRSAIRKGNKTAGEYCCKQWVHVAENSINSYLAWMQPTNKIVDMLFGGGTWDYCCETVPNLCKAKGVQKAECVNGALKGGANAENAFAQCAVECGQRGYTELIYQPGVGYDPAQVEELVKSCSQVAAWEPSPTVLTPSELAPVVPPAMKEFLTVN